MTAYCIHELPAEQCAECAPRPPRQDTLVMIIGPDSTYDADGNWYHYAWCHTIDVRHDRKPWERREITRAEIAAHPGWVACGVCSP